VGLMGVGGTMFAVPLGVGSHVVLTVLLGICFTGIIYTNTNTLVQRCCPADRVGTGVGLFVAFLYLPATIAGYVFANDAADYGWATAGLIQMVFIPALGVVAMLFVRPPVIARISNSHNERDSK
jgi:hypothetical protein